MLTSVVKWKFNDIDIDRNPDTFSLRPEKKVLYKQTIDGDEVRISPPRDAISMHLELGWRMIEEEWRNRFHDWFIQDKKFTLRSHLKDNPRDVWTVKIDEFDAPYLISNPNRQRWDLTLKLAVVDPDNDPILRQLYDEIPHLFVVQNNTNTTIHDAYVFLRPLLDSTASHTFDGKESGQLSPVPHAAHKHFGEATPLPHDVTWEEFNQDEYDAITRTEGILLDDFDFVDEDYMVDDEEEFDEQDELIGLFSHLFGIGTYEPVLILLEETEPIPEDKILGTDFNEDDPFYNLFEHMFGVEHRLVPLKLKLEGEGYASVLLKFNLGDINARENVNSLSLEFVGYGYGYESDNISFGMKFYCFNQTTSEYDLIHTDTSDGHSTITIELEGDYRNYITNQNDIFFMVKTTHPSGNVEGQLSVINIDSAMISNVSQRFIQNASVKQTFLNLVDNPGFEHGMRGWVDESDSWLVDYVYYYEGSVGVKTNTSQNGLYQDVHCPSGEFLTFMFTCRGDTTIKNAVAAKLSYIDHEGNVLGEYAKNFDVTLDHTTHWFSTDEPTPEGTRKVRVSFAKRTGSGYIYIDRVLLRLGVSEVEPEWTSHAHRTIKYNGVVGKDEVLRLNLGTRSADIDGLEGVTDRLSGEWFSLPVGRSLIVIEDEGGSSLSEAVIRYNEVNI